jgi:Cu2+-exporting ATPase
MVGGIHCAACVARLERTFGHTAGVTRARVNLTTRRMLIDYNPALTTPEDLMALGESIGYTMQPYDPGLLERADRKAERHLLLCIAVAGFASMNVMLLSVALWAGHTEMDAATRLFMQAISALIVVPAVAYAGMPFFTHAWRALRHGSVNMDVPISLAVILTTSLSVADTWLGAGETYFESAAMLLFFLLVGRYLDTRARGKNRSAAEQLIKLQSQHVRRIKADGTVESIPPTALKVGDLILVPAGQRIGADGTVEDGISALDLAFLTGESLPQTVTPGQPVPAGALNVEAPLRICVSAVGEATTLAQLAKLVDEATQAKNKYTRLADRVARAYAPLVHTLALGTFLVWFFALGASFHQSLLYAAAVLIVTCPCALALAVPAVQVALVSKLLRHGIILKVPDALERLIAIQSVVFDKTGTLTTGHLTLVSNPPAKALAIAAAMALHSTHPLSMAIAAAAPNTTPWPKVKEHPGKGLSATHNGHTYKLGSPGFCNVLAPVDLKDGQSAIILTSTAPNFKPITFVLADTLKPDATATLHQLQTMGLTSYLLSGDAPATVQTIGQQAGLPASHILGGQTPKQKYAFLKNLEAQNQPALMCGDGMNDAPSLAAARVALSFGTASAIAQTSADFILQDESLRNIPRLYRWAWQGHRAVLMNFGLSFAYNIVTVPMAMAGYITPLGAAVAMSTSSLLVVMNALRIAR